MKAMKYLSLILALVIVLPIYASNDSWIRQPIKVDLRSNSTSVVRPLCSFNRLTSLSENEVQVSCRHSDDVWSDWFALNMDEVLESDEPWVEVRIRSLATQKHTVKLSADFLGTCTKIKDRTEIIERDQWGAEKPAGQYRKQIPDTIILHHSWIPAHRHYREIKSVRGIQRYHMHSPYTGWDDIGYHYLVGPEGMVYRGRPEDVVGAHCVPNSGKVGICIIGNHDEGEDPLHECTWREVENLVLQIAGRHDIPPDRMRGHCDYSSKTCPGYVVYKRFEELREKFETIGFHFEK